MGQERERPGRTYTQLPPELLRLFFPAQRQPQCWLVPGILFPKKKSLLLSTRSSGLAVPHCTALGHRSPGSLTEAGEQQGPAEGRGRQWLWPEDRQAAVITAWVQPCHQGPVRQAVYSRSCHDKQLPVLEVQCQLSVAEEPGSQS